MTSGGPVAAGVRNETRPGDVEKPRHWPHLPRVGIAASIVSIAWFVLLWRYSFGPPVLGWFALPVTSVLGTVTAAQVSREPGMTCAARRVWRSLAYSTIVLLLAITSLTRDYLAGSAGSRRHTSTVTAALFLTALVIGLWGALRLPIQERTRHEWITVSFDIGTVLVASGLLIWYATLQIPQRHALIWLSIVLTAAFGILVAIKVSLTAFSGVDQCAMRVLATTVLAGSVLSSGIPVMSGGTDVSNTMFTVPLTYLGIFFAAELQHRAVRGQSRPFRRRWLPFSLLPYVAIAGTDALMLAATRGSPPAARLMVVGSVALTGLIVMRQTIAFFDNRRYQDQLAYRATHDALTGLANRALFCERTDQALAEARSGDVAVAIVDLDDFKGINDRLGHTVGDALLSAVSLRLRDCVRPHDLVARLGGDEFAILLTDLGRGRGSRVAARILAALTQPVDAAGHHLLIHASIGLAERAPEPGAARTAKAEDLLRRADIAMYAAKELGKNRYVHYDEQMDARAVEHSELAAELSGALEHDELFLLYQPIVDLASGRMVGVESLVRWRHSRDGLVSPVRFIPVAERTGLIVPIGAWILQTACRQAADWQRRLGARAPDRVTVNVSARQLLDPAFAETVAAALADTGLDPARLTVEITETAVFGGGRAVETVAAIHALGVSIALDDFGTGHSSLGLLRTCPVDILKVDKSFVDEITRSTGHAAITAAIIEIAQALGLRAIAEGVETQAQVDRLLQLGYQLGQGFHFARPLPPAEVEQVLPAGDRPPVAV